MKEPAIRPQVTSIAAHSGREIVLFSNYAVVVLEMQRLDDLQDSSVVLLADDRVEDSLDANCWCYGAFRQCGIRRIAGRFTIRKI